MTVITGTAAAGIPNFNKKMLYFIYVIQHFLTAYMIKR